MAPDGSYEDFPYDRYTDYIAEHIEDWSYLKFPYAKKWGSFSMDPDKPGGVYRTNTLARLNACDYIDTPLAQAELEVFRTMRAVWPADKPMSVRISAHDWVEGGLTPDDAVEIARLFKAAGADLVDCSSGQVSKKQKPVYGRMYQTPFADRIRNEVDIATIAVGAIFEPDHVNSIIAAGASSRAPVPTSGSGFVLRCGKLRFCQVRFI